MYAICLDFTLSDSKLLGYYAAGNAGMAMAMVARVATDATLAVIGIIAAETAAIVAIATIAVYCALSLCGKRAGMAAVV
ncbi:hypothetical protein HY798_02375 [Candidatus Falkowbacteria bacterium]|nr:hypothetical protein [Candidatus Falkowbacteria bacterium]